MSAVCELCTDSPSHCNNLHIFYLIGSILTMCGCLYVIITYICTSRLREHPAVLIFSRCLYDFLFGCCFFGQYFLTPSDLACDPTHCNILGAIILFCFLASQGYFAALLADLNKSVKNPFCQPHKDVKTIHICILFISLGLTLLVSFHYSFSYRVDLQYCSISTSQTNGFIYQIVLIYLSMSGLLIASIVINIYANWRFKVGLPDTFDVKRPAIKALILYCLGYMVYFIVLGLCYGMVWYDDKKHNDSHSKDEGGWHYVFALIVTFLGVNDFLLWIYRQYRSYKTKQKNKTEYDKIPTDEASNKIRPSLLRDTVANKQFIVPAQPEHIEFMKSQNNDDQNRCCNFKQISLKPTISDESINKALRREVLAYTTDAIAQSIDRQLKAAQTFYEKSDLGQLGGLNDEDFPQSLNDDDRRTVEKFTVDIIHNKHLLYDVDDIEPALGGVRRMSTAEYNEENEASGIGKRRTFTDYAPIVFKYIRNRVCGISDQSYNRSIIPKGDKNAQKNVLDAKYGEGKSGAFFYFTHDSKYLVKTIKKSEVQVMVNTLKQYVKHIEDNPNTILSRVVGLHSIRLYGLTKYFVVTENVFLSKLKPSEVYDLKGSWVGRYTKYSMQSGKTLKDGDLKRFIVLSEDSRDRLIEQLNADSTFLSSCNIMDYSLLLGVYHIKMAQHDNDNDDDDDNDKEEEKKEEALNLDNYNVDGEEKKQSLNDEKRETLVLNNYAGGIRAEILETPGLYYMGIIDTLQVYNGRKKWENCLKSCLKWNDRNGISCVEPSKYQKRFMHYMEHIVVTDKNYYQELQVPKTNFTEQSMLVYPAKDAVDRCIEEAQKSHGSSCEYLRGAQRHKKSQKNKPSFETMSVTNNTDT